MASRSGRRGEFPPESKQLMENAMKVEDDDLQYQELAGPQPRRTSARSINVTAAAAASTTKSKAKMSVPTLVKKSSTTSTNAKPSNSTGVLKNDEGCMVCHRDVDHANLLLCEACNDEYHTYCLKPPLQSVPEGDFFCDKCKRIHDPGDDDGLDSLVSALSPAYTSRFGEIVWAAGGVGFGWWPACVYDPRLTVGGARQLARKNLGKKHLVYFFECDEAPFTVLGDNRLTKWEDGFIEEYDLGKVARSGGKNKSTLFERAMHVAQLEHGRPIEARMDWNHQISFPTPKLSRQRSGSLASDNPAKKQREMPPLKVASSFSHQSQNFMLNRKNVTMAINSCNNRGGANAIEPLEDGTLICKILRRLPAGAEGTAPRDGSPQFSINIGFITLPSRQSATFAAIRQAIERDLEDDSFPSGEKGKKRWKFYIPKLGPMSLKQETNFGPALEFLLRTTDDINLGNGTASNPLKIVIMDVL